MTDAIRDQNRVTVMLGVSSTDDTVTLPVKIDPVTGRTLVNSASGSGDVVGPGSATDNAIARFDGTTGKLIQNSVVIVADTTGNISGMQKVTIGVAGSATGSLELKGLTSGTVTLKTADVAGTWTLTLPADDGTANQFLQTDGNGVTIWASGGTGTVTSVSVTTANGVSGSVATATTTPAITITLGAITPTSVNGLTISTTTGTFTLTNAKTFAVTNTITLSGTDSTIMTFPSTSATIARTDAGNTFTGVSTGSAWVLTSPTITTKLNPTSDDGAPLGDTTHNWSDLFLATGAVINYANSNVVITHTSGILTMGTGDLRITTAGTNTASVVTVGGAQTLTSKVLTAATITTSLVATTDDGAALGDTTHNFSDLFLASGAVLNYANSNVVITHTSGILTMGTGDFRVTTAGTNTASVVTVGGTQTLTAKTLTAPTLGGATALADGATIKIIVPTVDGTATGPTTAAFVSGYTSSAIGDLVYLDSASKWQKTDSDALATTTGLLGIALAVAATDAALLVALPGSIVYATAFPTLTIGAPYYVGETAGAIQATIPTGADNAVRVVGFGVHADKLFFLPSSDTSTTVA